MGVLGLAFKPQTDDVRESPSIDLIRALVQKGAAVTAYDPKASSAAKGLLPESVAVAPDPIVCAEGAQAVVLMTEWNEIVEADWEAIAAAAKLPRFLFDGRNALDPIRMRSIGFQYQGVGRGVAISPKIPA